MKVKSIIGIGFKQFFLIAMKYEFVLRSLLQESDQNQEQISDG